MVLNAAVVLWNISPRPEDWFTASGLVNDMYFMLAVNFIFPPLMFLMDYEFVMNLFCRRRLTEDKLQELNSDLAKYRDKEDPADRDMFRYVEEEVRSWEASFEPTHMDLPRHYANAEKTYFCCLIYMPLMPLAPLLGFASLLFQYLNDKWMLLRYCRRPSVAQNSEAAVQALLRSRFVLPWLLPIVMVYFLRPCFQHTAALSIATFLSLMPAVVVLLVPIKSLAKLFRFAAACDEHVACDQGFRFGTAVDARNICRPCRGGLSPNRTGDLEILLQLPVLKLVLTRVSAAAPDGCLRYRAGERASREGGALLESANPAHDAQNLDSFRGLARGRRQGLFEIRTFSHNGKMVRGLAATGNFKAGEPIMLIPKPLLLESAVAGAAPRFAGAKKAAGKLALLLAERRAELLSGQSVMPSELQKFWQEYFATLPSLQEYRRGSLIAAPEEDLRSLQGLPRLGRVAERLLGPRQRLKEALDLYNERRENRPKLSWEDALWGFAVSTTRGANGIIVPILDFINTAEDPAANNVHFVEMANGPGKAVFVVAGNNLQEIQTGEELLADYGHHGLHLLTQYGVQNNASGASEDFSSADCAQLRKAKLDSVALEPLKSFVAERCGWRDA
ncbi:unnamed protein product [Effrenium voratum]|nr:unnamed protein product [Effrenium voratum]